MEEFPKIGEFLEVEPSIIGADRVGARLPVPDSIAEVDAVTFSIETDENVPAVR